VTKCNSEREVCGLWVGIPARGRLPEALPPKVGESSSMSPAVEHVCGRGGGGRGGGGRTFHEGVRASGCVLLPRLQRRHSIVGHGEDGGGGG